MTEPTVNIPLLRKAVEWAEVEAAKPESIREWEQSIFVTPPEEFAAEGFEKAPECGTCYCIAGYVAVAVCGQKLNFDWEAHDVAMESLGLKPTQADALFRGGNTIEDVRRIAESIAGERL